MSDYITPKELRMIINLRKNNWRKMHGIPMERHRTKYRAMVYRLMRQYKNINWADELDRFIEIKPIPREDGTPYIRFLSEEVSV